MKKRINWNTVPWTPFQPAHYDPADLAGVPDVVDGKMPDRLWLNSRYQVGAWQFEHPVFGTVAHLSIKTRDRQARHDWRDLQRIKNELCGPECDAIEIYPAESKLVDTANQYHLFVFASYKLDIGFQHRLVADGAWMKSKQRPFETRPSDALNDEQMSAHVVKTLNKVEQS